MKILAIADEESPYLWDFFEKSKLEGIDLIISCGDLEPSYLSFLATFTSARTTKGFVLISHSVFTTLSKFYVKLLYYKTALKANFTNIGQNQF